LIDGNLELGVVSYDPRDERLIAQVIFTDSLAFVVSPAHRLAGAGSVSIKDLGRETFIAHNVLSPYREAVLREFQKHQVELNMDIEMPTIETIRKLVQANLGVAFLPRMCVEPEIAQGNLYCVKVHELSIERKVHLLRPAKRVLSYAANGFLAAIRG
jgi:DNA-binding transcriptional LysR family regulator